jgi:hypothetical protein
VGREALCGARLEGRTSTGKLKLETDQLLFRGGFRLSIRLEDVSSVSARNGRLQIVWLGREAVFELGPASEQWAHDIVNPKSLLDKLGVKEGMKLSLLGMDGDFRAELERRDVDVSLRRRRDSDLVFLAVESRRDLSKIKDLERFIKQDGAMWIVSPRGRPELVSEGEIYGTARGLGLTDVKVVRFSDTHTANKFVVPRSRRH